VSEARVVNVGQASWGALEVRMIEATPGRFFDPPRAQDRLMVHLGPPARTTGGYDGRRAARLQRRGDIDIIPTGSGGVWDDQDPTSTMTIWVCPSLLKVATRGAGERLSGEPRTQQRDAQLFRLALILKAETQRQGAADRLFVDSIGLALASRVLGRYGVADRIRAGAQLPRRKLSRTLDFIEENLDGEVAISALARIADLSPSHFRVLFRRTVGSSVHRYIIERRVARARMLLEDGRSTISQAALESGFSDQSHLARRMRQVIGLTPSDVRRG
ncbi:MAG: AraC family transcriptional regulator, partial [Caulobacteraceae bacterium]